MRVGFKVVQHGWVDVPCDDSFVLVPIRIRLLLPEYCHMS